MAKSGHLPASGSQQGQEISPGQPILQPHQRGRRALTPPVGKVAGLALLSVERLPLRHELGRIALPLVSALFLACALYVPAYLRLRAERPSQVFCAALLAFLAMMTLMIESQHLGLMWVALEATTLLRTVMDEIPVAVFAFQATLRAFRGIFAGRSTSGAMPLWSGPR